MGLQVGPGVLIQSGALLPKSPDPSTADPPWLSNMGVSENRGYLILGSL